MRLKDGVRPAEPERVSDSGSIVLGTTGTCTSSRYFEVIMNTRIFGKASMKLV